jgi:hypothetical protein
MSSPPRDGRGAWILRAVRGSTGLAPRRIFRPAVFCLEPRALLSSMPTVPTNDEQYMLQLINRARANPPAEAARIVALAQSDPTLKAATAGLDLSSFVQQASSVSSLPPLAFNTRLIAAAMDHDAVILAQNDQVHAPSGFLVTGAGGLVAGDGQVYYPTGQSSWSTGENVFAFSGNVNPGVLKNYVDYFHEGLMIDWGNADFGHLKNILAPGPGEAKAAGTLPYSEIGIGLLIGSPTTPPPANPEIPANQGLNVGPVILTQEFAWKTGNAFLTGAVYRDSDSDNFYTPGEGLGGVSIQAVGLHGEGTYATQTWGSGGYSLALPPGTYTVTASGPSASVRTQVLSIGQDNVGWDVQYAATTSADQPVPGNYDGTGRTVPAVYHAATGTWYIDGASPHAVQFGLPNVDVPVPGDYDGVGHTELAVYRPTTGEWIIQGPTGVRTVRVGTPGLDNPVPGDYDGDGKTDFAVYRPSTGQWFVVGSNSAGHIVQLGQPNVDIPVPADYDGDGKTDFAVYRPTTGEWLVVGSNSPGHIVQLGQPGIDVPVPADYDGDGKADFAVYRPTTGEWLIIGTNSPGHIIQLGQPGGDTPVPADYDGDHIADLVIYRPTTATWLELKSREPGAILQFGQGGSGKAQTALRPANVTNYGVLSARYVASPAAKTAAGAKSVPRGPRQLKHPAAHRAKAVRAKP